jgi:hypothetical protein
MENITFTNLYDTEYLHPPKPALKHIPNWYKELDSYTHGKKEILDNSVVPTTIKRCMPVFDSMTAGYIIFTPYDLFVTQTTSEDDPLTTQPFYHWKGKDFISFHDISQAPNYPNNLGHTVSFPKFINQWGIKTPRGYSTMFIQPTHRDSVFTIFPGIVDTDRYTDGVNIPFILNDINFSGLIPAGTPIAQVIPFKRDSWKMNFGKEKDLEDSRKVRKKVTSIFFDGYKTMFREKKDFS